MCFSLVAFSDTHSDNQRSGLHLKNLPTVLRVYQYNRLSYKNLLCFQTKPAFRLGQSFNIKGSELAKYYDCGLTTWCSSFSICCGVSKFIQSCSVFFGKAIVRFSVNSPLRSARSLTLSMSFLNLYKLLTFLLSTWRMLLYCTNSPYHLFKKNQDTFDCVFSSKPSCWCHNGFARAVHDFGAVFIWASRYKFGPWTLHY